MREIAALKQCLADAAGPELQALRAERLQLLARLERLEREPVRGLPADERDQAVSCSLRLAFVFSFYHFRSQGSSDRLW